MSYEERRKEVNQRIGDEYKRFVDALTAKGHTCDGNVANNPLYEIDGVYVGVQITAERYGGSYSLGYTGKLRLLVGSRSYPEPKAGFDMDKCIERILNRKDEVVASDQQEEDRRKRKADTRKFFNSQGERLVKLATGLAEREESYGHIWLKIKEMNCELNEVDGERISFLIKAKPEVIERIIRALKE